MSVKTVEQYMSRFPHCVAPEHSLAAAHRLMRRHQIRHLPVMDGRKLVGIVSQRDLYFLETLTDVNSEIVTVVEAMQEEVMTVDPSTPIPLVAGWMADRKAGSVVVVRGEQVLGIFTAMDALKVLAEASSSSELLQPAPI